MSLFRSLDRCYLPGLFFGGLLSPAFYTKEDKGPSIKYVEKQSERGSPKCQRYNISLYSKPVNVGRGKGDQKILKIMST